MDGLGQGLPHGGSLQFCSFRHANDQIGGGAQQRVSCEACEKRKERSSRGIDLPQSGENAEYWNTRIESIQFAQVLKGMLPSGSGLLGETIVFHHGGCVGLRLAVWGRCRKHG